MNQTSQLYRASSKPTSEIFIVIPLLLVVAFWRSFGLWRFGDDWTFVVSAKEALERGAVLYYISHPIAQHWSPLWHAVEISNYALVGLLSDSFIRCFNIATQVLSLVVLVLLCRHWRFSRATTLCSMIVFGLHHTSAAALYSFDTYSQCATDFLGWLGALLLVKSLDADRRQVGAISLVLLLLALLFKEQGLATAAVYIWILCWSWLSASARSYAWKRVVIAVAPTVAIVVAFAMVRRYAGVPFQLEGAFKLSPLDVPKNLSQISVALLSPIRTIAWFDAFRTDPREWLDLLLLLGALGAVTLAIGVGLRHTLRLNGSGNEHPIFCIVGAMVVSWFPTSLMAHVGELYVHTSLFWFSLLVGVAVQGWLQAYSGPAHRAAVLAVFAVYALSLTAGLRSNLFEMRMNGERARSIAEKMSAAVSSVKRGTVVYVCNVSAQTSKTDYSLYRFTTYVSLLGLRWSTLTGLFDGLGSHVRFSPDICLGNSPDPAVLARLGPNPCVLLISDDSVVLKSCPNE